MCSGSAHRDTVTALPRSFQRKEGGFGAVEVLFCTSLVALVGLHTAPDPSVCPRPAATKRTRSADVTAASGSAPHCLDSARGGPLAGAAGAGEQPAFSPRRLRLFNTATSATIHEIDFVTMILKVWPSAPPHTDTWFSWLTNLSYDVALRHL